MKLFPLLLLFGAATAQPLDILQLTPCDSSFENYQPPYTTMTQVDQLLGEDFSGVDLDGVYPDVAVIVGGSTGIGRSLACHLAGLGSKVISIASALPPFQCQYDNNIFDYEFDISSPANRPIIRQAMNELGEDNIDFLFLNAGRDALGNLRDWEVSDLQQAYMNNVFGHHRIWLEARKYFNPDGAVVLGTSSVAAHTKFVAKRSVYHLTKLNLYELIHSYAVEEQGVQPNTHYAATIQNDAATNFGLRRITPKNLQVCTETLEFYGGVTYSALQQTGMSPADLSGAYHKIYALIKLLTESDAPINKFPQSVEVSPPATAVPSKEAMFNQWTISPELTQTCFAEKWTIAKTILENDCYGQCPGGFMLVPFVDPREVMPCAPV